MNFQVSASALEDQPPAPQEADLGRIQADGPKITVEVDREIFPPKLFFEILLIIILMHNLAENRETGTGNSYDIVASDLVMKSLTVVWCGC